MGRYLLFRLGRTVLAAWGILSIIFLLTRWAATDIGLQTLQDAPTLGRGLSVGEQTRIAQQVRQRYGLDLPVFYLSVLTSDTDTPAWHPHWHWNGTRNQYHRWLRGVVQGDLGNSYREGTPVTKLLLQALRYTLPLTVSATFLATISTVLLASWVNYHSRWRGLVLAILHGIQALPLFLVALGLLLLLANPDALNWFPAFGLGDDTEQYSSWSEELLQYLRHLVLPVFSLLLVALPGFVVQLDGAMQQELREPYVATARAKGAPPVQVVRKHVLHNALLPVLPLFTELLPSMVTGSVVVEMVYALPGMGRLFVEAAAQQDLPVLLGVVLLVAIARLASQLLADALYQWADPRIRLHR